MPRCRASSATSAANPSTIRCATPAMRLEEVFESFWHLDGRVFRTLRDLLVPGRTALEYLAGHRQRYLPPLRMFVIMSLLAFFVGRATIHFDDEPSPGSTSAAITGKARPWRKSSAIATGMLAELEEGRKEGGKVTPGVDAGDSSPRR